MPNQTGIGVGCSECGFPMLVSPSDVGTVVTCPHCNEENDIISTPKRGARVIGGIAGPTIGIDTLFLFLFIGATVGLIGSHLIQFKRKGAPLGR